MAEVVGREGRVLVGLADVHRPPFPLGPELRPAVVAVDSALVALGRDGGADREAGRDPGGAGEGDEVGVEVGAVAGGRAARADGISLAPAFAVLHVAHPVDDVVVEGARPDELALLSGEDLSGRGGEVLARGHETFRREEFARAGTAGRVGGLLLPFHREPHLHRLAGIARFQLDEEDLVAVCAFLQRPALAGRPDRHDLDRLVRVRRRHRQPHPGLGRDLGKRGLVDELELVGSLQDPEVLVRRARDLDAVPRLVVLLLPGVVGLAVQLVDGRLGHLHVARPAVQEEVDVVDVSAHVGQVDARELPRRAEAGEVLGVDAHELEAKGLLLEGQGEVPAPTRDLRLDVLLDSRLDLGRHDVRRRGRRGR